MTNRTIFLTTALPYANGNFHFGHIMEYIQADIGSVISGCADQPSTLSAPTTPTVLRS